MIEESKGRLVYKWGKPIDSFLLLLICIFLWDNLRALSLSSIWPLLLAMPTLYILQACLINKTTITRDGDSLSVKHRPVPWPGGRTIPINEMKTLTRKKRVTRRTRHETYDLKVILKDGKQISLLRNLEEDEVRSFAIQFGKLLGLGLTFDDGLS